MVKPILIGITLLFWGWQTDLLIISLIPSLIYESSNFLKFKWKSSENDALKVLDATFFLTALLTAFLLVLEPKTTIKNLLTWLPLILFPLLITLKTGSRKLNLSTVFVLTRKKGKQNKKPKYLNIEHHYLILTLISAGAVNNRHQLFFPALILIFGLILLPQKAKRSSIMGWLMIILCCSGWGYLLQSGLLHSQQEIKLLVTEFILEHFNFDLTNPSKSRTSIGEIRKLKQSGRIMLRVTAEKNIILPMLLKEASYNFYHMNSWNTGSVKFKNIVKGRRGWQINKGPEKFENLNKLTIYTRIFARNKLIKYPENTIMVENTEAISLGINPFGALKVIHDEELEEYQLTLGKVDISDTIEKDHFDLHIPEREKLAVDSFISRESLDSLAAPVEILKKLKNIFISKYTYSLTYKVKEETNSLTDIGYFLLENKEGHCEYFATVSALILRRLKIPARYATGYSLQEYSGLEGKYVARKRHAHAWNEVLIDNRWQNFDATPPDWSIIENESASPLAIIRDFFSWLGFKLDELRKSDKNLFPYIMAAFTVLVTFYIWRIFFKDKKKKKEKIKSQAVKNQCPKWSKSTTFKLLEQTFNQRDYYRYDWESVGEWFTRLGNVIDSPFQSKDLEELLRLYYIFRFSTKKVCPADKEKFGKLLEKVVSK